MTGGDQVRRPLSSQALVKFGNKRARMESALRLAIYKSALRDAVGGLVKSHLTYTVLELT